MTTLALAFDILARDKASKEIDHVGASASKTSGKLGSLGGNLKSLGKTAGLAVGAAAAGMTAIAITSANKFRSVGGEVLKLQRYTGATAEEASRLRFAAKQSGIDVDVLTKSFGLLSKNLAGTKLDKLNLGLKDAKGHALPLNESLLKIAARFEKMPNGAEKTALAMQIFGKSGAQLIPFLNKGAAGIAELEKQSDKFGATLSGQDLESVKAATKNQRLFTAATEGLQIQIGRYVLPVLTKFASAIATNLPSAFGVVRAVMDRIKPVFESIGQVLDSAIGNVQMFANALATGFTEDEGTPIEMFALSLRETLLPVLQKVTSFIKGHFKPIAIALGAAFGVWAVSATAAAVASLAAAAPFIAVGAAIAGVAAGLIYAYQHFETFRNVVNGVVSFMQTTVVPAVQGFVAAVAQQFSNLAGWVSEHWAAIQEAIGHVVVAVQAIIDAFVAVASAAWRMWGDNVMSVVKTAFGTVVQIIKSVVGIVSGVIETIVNLVNGDWGKAWDSFKGIIQAAWDGVLAIISGAVTTVVSIVSGIGEAVGRAASGMFDGIKSAFKSVINWIIDKWNGLEFKIPGFDPPGPGPKFKGFTLGVPDIPKLHTGGTVTSSGIKPLRSDEILATLQTGEKVFPRGTDPAAGTGGPLIGTVNVHPYQGEDPISALWRTVRHHQNIRQTVAVR